MNIRQDIAELLRAGTPQIHICRQLHVSPLTVQRHREALGLPAPKRGPVRPATLKDAFRRYAQPTGDGHVTWSGPAGEGGVPRFRFKGTVHYARRLAFVFHHGREPIGNITVGCAVEGCIAGRCVEDRLMRERAQSLYAAIFGEAS